MIINVSFGSIDGDVQPDRLDIDQFFINPGSPRWFAESRSDEASVHIEGAVNTGHLALGNGRVDVSLIMWGVKGTGVMIWYWQMGSGGPKHFMSKGDMGRLKEFYRTAHGDLRPLAFFIPFDEALLAVKELIASEGALPASIEWVNSDDLPDHTFPEPHDPEFAHIR